MDSPAQDGLSDEAERRKVQSSSPRQRQCILVLGMHRSGTSALTRVLSLLGAALPKNLMGAGPGNETGHWEPARLAIYNDSLLAELGSSWDDWRPLDLATFAPKRRAEVKTEIRAHLDADYGDQPLIIVKEPRTCRFAQLFLEVLDEGRWDTRVVLAFRNPIEVAASLAQRTSLWSPEHTPAIAHLMWLRHVLDAERASRQRLRAIVSYDSLLDDWQGVLARLTARLNVTTPYSADDVAPQVNRFLAKEQRHHRAPREDVRLDPALSTWIADCLEALQVLERNHTSAAALATLDRIGGEFGHTSPVLAQVLAETRERSAKRVESVEAEAALLKQELVARQAERDALAAQSAEASTALSAAQSEVEATKSERDAAVAEAEQVRQELAAKLAEATAALSAAQSEVEATKSERDAAVAEAERASQQLPAKLAETTAALSAAQSEVEATKSERDAAVAEAEQVRQELAAKLAEATAALSERGKARAERDVAIAEAEQVRQELAAKLAEATAALSERGKARAERDAAVAEAKRLSGEVASTRVAALQQLADVHATYQNSTSWMLTTPLRRLKHPLRKTAGAWHSPEILPAVRASGGATTHSEFSSHPPRAIEQIAPDITFFTICSRNFMAFARTLQASLVRFHPGVRFFVALCDDNSPHAPFEAANEPFEVISLDDLNLPEWREMSARYNITEFNTAIKPFVFQYLFEKVGAKNVIYLDPDIYVVNRLVELEAAFQSEATAILTPHMLEPAPNAEMNEKRLLQYGIYNLGFLGVRNTPESCKLMEWWGQRLKTDCVIKRDEGLFVDQKWADHFPAFLPGTLVLPHPGYNVAYWNLSSRKIQWTGQTWEVNGKPLRFFHFSGCDLDNPECLSRHSYEHRVDTIGHVKYLLDEYRGKIFGAGHAEYRRIPYAFSWEGKSGVNEHTPRPEYQQRSGEDAVPAPSAASPRSILDASHSAANQASPADLVLTALRIAGGPGNLAVKAAKVLRTGSLQQVKERIDYVRRLAESSEIARPMVVQERKTMLPWRRNVLFIEWSTPKPNQDSGSRTAFYFMEILILLGYDVTFLPANFRHAGKYTHALEQFGAFCVHNGVADSMEAYLRQAGARFDVVVLNRVHVSAPLLRLVHEFCPQAKIIFNTVDLHYIREIRDAGLAGAPLDEALKTKAAELALIEAAEETIVLSHVERDILLKELPDANVCVLPLVFSEIDPHPPAYSARKDILFIGSFPHKPNADAVLAFANDVFPKLRAKRPDIQWHIVGSEPTPEILALGERPGIVVHGFVDDLTELFRSVRLSIAPLRFGAGIKGKIATSLSYGVPVVASPIAVEGMEVVEGEQVCVARDADDWVDTIIALHDDEARWSRMSQNAQSLSVAQYSVAANSLRVAELMRRLDPDLPDLQLFRFASKREHDYLRGFFPNILSTRASRELALLPEGEDTFSIPGFCAVCGQPRSFQTSFMYACEQHATIGRSVPNWREHLACDGCTFTMRLRAAMHLFFSRFYGGEDKALYITEQATPLYAWLKARHPSLVGSEYLGDKCPLARLSPSRYDKGVV